MQVDLSETLVDFLRRFFSVQCSYMSVAFHNKSDSLPAMHRSTVVGLLSAYCLMFVVGLLSGRRRSTNDSDL